MSLSPPQRAPLPITLLPISPLNVPRRSTVSAPSPQTRMFDAPPLYPASSSSSTRRHTDLSHSRSSSPASASDARPRIRPLPDIPIPPGPRSAPPLAPRRQTSTSSFRPLPRVPEVSVSLSVTPASPVDPPPLRVLRSETHLFAPSPVVPPPRFASLSLRLDTSPDAMESRRPIPPPVTLAPMATIPQSAPSPGLPSPTTARQRRISKLRRHLGESVQIVFTDAESGREFGDVCSQTAVAVKKLLELDAADDSDTSDDEDVYSPVLAHGHDGHCAISLKRYSAKWVREEGSRQFVEENYSAILRDLRAL
ncbi:hypothetical protein FB45DRAFT_867522 [Roridomyces roridus]|uniref:Uncharacterized protein n=1 Tax=Roridomyces roridus TaxID=1738132 RepID=A0AAD7FJP6_9AGAR|nr:hypothetical protein FB45DRAFT_867522 [Roridomyces roridus]